MWKDKLKKIVDDVCNDVKDAYEDVKEEFKSGKLEEDIKNAGMGLTQAAEDIKDKIVEGFNENFREGTTETSNHPVNYERENTEAVKTPEE